MDDILDLVNENDEVVGQVSRLKAHNESLLHRISFVMLFKDEDFSEVLLQVRGDEVIDSPGKISVPGGHVLTGETYIEGAKRELSEEEFNNNLPSLDIEELFKFKRIDEAKFCTVFRTVYNGEFVDQEEESKGHFFMDMNKLFADIDLNPDKYAEHFLILMENYRKFVK